MTKNVPKAERRVYKSSSKHYGLNQTTDEVSQHLVTLPKGGDWEKLKKKCIRSIQKTVERSKR